MKKKISKFICLGVGLLTLGGLLLNSHLNDSFSVVKAEGEITDPKVTVDSGNWIQTTEGDDTVFSNAGGGGIWYDDPTTDNAFEVQIRHNVFLVDRNVNLNIYAGGIPYSLDLRQDSATVSGTPRIRINGGFNEYSGKVACYETTDWITFKIVFMTNKMICYIDDALIYNYDVTFDPACEKQIIVSSWDIPASFKNIRHYTVSESPVMPTSLFDGYTGRAKLNGVTGTSFLMNGGGANHPYTGSLAFNTFEFDMAIFNNDSGDRNCGFYFMIDDVEYGFRFDMSSYTQILCTGKGTTLALGPVVDRLSPVHIKLIIEANCFAIYADDEFIAAADPKLSDATLDSAKFWVWNMEVYTANATPSTTVDTKLSQVRAFVGTCMHMTDYTESAGLCKGETGYYRVAKTALLLLGEDCITIFTTEDEFAAAKLRYETWAAFNGDTGHEYENDFTHLGSASMRAINNDSNVIYFVVAGAILLVSCAAVALFLLKKKHN